MRHSRPLFRYFRIFDSVDSKQMFNIKFARELIRTVDLWCQKQPLYQLGHNHCPPNIFFKASEMTILFRLPSPVKRVKVNLRAKIHSEARLHKLKATFL